MKPPDSHSTEETYDQWLVLRVQDGDEQALRRLVERWGPRLRRQALRLTGRPDAAADATQEAWLAIIRGLTRLDDPACFRRWAYRIVGNKCADWVRRQQTNRERAAPLLHDPPAASDSDGASDRTDALRQALTRLSPQERTLLAMHYLDTMPLAEIAEAMTVPVGTLKSRLYHARKKLAAAIRRDPNSPYSGEQHDE
ncbi:ECF RNA polymerase sigma factor SigW [Pseudobythopirellula maris]|uniref:ECF RNA polymerase sigma factor SigW n=1 Tax=Pseudobythopirellula maris TaxID=2527991 RepID=A0A5C5ZM64_9BACT|nr:sigma-70 family RNA polymerase sigma factor [Pseudobythopirellula maris]TWT88489.1 ECF RNA polymerase sigma factor SigW [Pseudobythopirellula maris]